MAELLLLPLEHQSVEHVARAKWNARGGANALETQMRGPADRLVSGDTATSTTAPTSTSQNASTACSARTSRRKFFAFAPPHAALNMRSDSLNSPSARGPTVLADEHELWELAVNAQSVETQRTESCLWALRLLRWIQPTLPLLTTAALRLLHPWGSTPGSLLNLPRQRQQPTRKQQRFRIRLLASRPSMKISAILFPAVLLGVVAAGNPQNAAQQYSPVTSTTTQQQQPTPAPTAPVISTPAPTKTTGVPTAAPTKQASTPFPTKSIQQHEGPTPAPSTTESCTNVSVEGDATYCIQGPVCSGSGNAPAGASCPVKGDVAVQDCIETLPSWTGASTCVAPVDAICARVKSGAWGCLYGQPKVGDFPTPAPTMPEAYKLPTPAPTWVDITPAPTTPCPSKDVPPPTYVLITPAPTTPETYKLPTPAPSTSLTPCPQIPGWEKTPAPSPTPTYVVITPAPTTPSPPKTGVPTPSPTVPKSEAPPTPLPTTPCPSTPVPSVTPSITTPCPTMPVPSVTPSSTTPCPTTPVPSVTPSITTPCPTTPMPTATPASTTSVPTPPSPGKPSKPTLTTETPKQQQQGSSSTTQDQQQQQQQQQQGQGSSSTTQQISTANGAAATGASTTSTSSAGIAAIAAGVGTVLAAAAFGLYKYRQHTDSRSLHVWEGQVMTPVMTPVV